MHPLAPLWLVGPILIFVQFTPAQSGPSSKPADTTPLAARMEFLFDDSWIDRKSGVERVLGSPVKLPQPMLAAAAPWEALGLSNFSVIYDGDEHKFKMWYRAAVASGSEPAADDSAKPPSERQAAHVQHFLCYAESGDGIQWARTPLNRFSFEGKKDNNILRAMNDADKVFFNILNDPADPDPQRRFKALGFDTAARSNLRGHPRGGTGLCVAFSADGFSWSDPLLVMDTSDITDSDCILPQRDPGSGQWIAYLRPRTSPKRRFIGYSASNDFEHWTHPRMLLTPDAADEEWTEFYGMSVAPIAGWRVGAMWVLRNNPQSSPMTNELVYSRDGVDYRRAMPRTPFVPLGPQGAFDSMMLMPRAVIERDGEILIYYHGSNSDHGSDRSRKSMTSPHTATGEPPKEAIGLARLKWGQFCGLRAADDGVVETKWVANYGRTGVQAVADIGKEGFIKAEILDQFGSVIPGWSQDESRHGPGPRGALEFFWNRPDLTGGAGQVSAQGGKVGHVVKLRFHLHNATLFGFQVGEQGTAPAYLDRDGR